MKTWEKVQFGDVIISNPSLKVRKGELVENCEMEDIDPSRKFAYPRSGKIYKGGNSKFQNGDTLFARITPCLENGKIAQVSGLKANIGIGSTEFFVFRGKPGYTISDFVYYMCKSSFLRDVAVNSMTGASGRQRAEIDALKKATIYLPPIEVQSRIVEILNSFDLLIENIYKRVSLLEQLSISYFKEKFVRNRCSKSTTEEGSINQSKKVGSFKLSEIASVIGRGISPQYSLDGESLVLNQKCIRNNRINLKLARIQSKKIPNEKRIRPGDILINSTGEGTLGRTAQIWGEYDFLTADSHITIVRPLSMEYAEFLGLAIQMLEGYFESMALGSTGQTELGRKVIAEALIPVHSLEKIEQFSSLVRPINQEIANLLIQIEKLKNARDRIMPALISQDLNIRLLRDFEI